MDTDKEESMILKVMAGIALSMMGSMVILVVIGYANACLFGNVPTW